MGYKMPIVCKEVHLPIGTDDQNLSLEQYKEKYGIDLIDILGLRIEGGAIHAYFKPLIKYYIVTEDGLFSNQFQRLMLAQVQATSQYDEGNTDAVTYIGGYDVSDEAWCGIKLVVDKDVTISMSNIRISLYEL